MDRQAPGGQPKERALDARGGSSNRTNTFAADYVPLTGGRPSTALPYAAIRPMRKIRQECEGHGRAAYGVCKARKLRVRKCCAAGHHQEGYVRRKYVATRRTLYCLAHGQPACHSCRTQQKGSHHCCALGHHQGFSPRKYRRRPRDPGGPPTPDDGDGGAQTSGMVHVISDDSGDEALDTPPLADVDTASATTTSTTSTTMQAYKRPRTTPLAAPSPRNPSFLRPHGP